MKTIGILLSLVMLLSVFGGLTLTSSAAAPEPENGALLTFGSYPQTLVPDGTLKDELDSLIPTLNRTYYDYYVDSAPEDFYEIRRRAG
ncbi:MAG: hypothetical protein K6G90_05960 [Clostridia bacterium]|nr:hypothetical protein [Clostridia bacterium]